MKIVGIFEAKTTFTRYAKGTPVARIVPIEDARLANLALRAR